MNEGLPEFDGDRSAYLGALIEGLDDPELKLDGPVHQAQRVLFDYDTWPGEYDADHFRASLKSIAEHYDFIFKLWHGDLYMVQLIRQWKDVALYVLDNKKHWPKLGYRGVWKKVMLHADTGPVAKLLVEIDGAIALDTSCVKMWIGLLGRVKNSRRSRMSGCLLNNLMFIRLHAPR